MARPPGLLPSSPRLSPLRPSSSLPRSGPGCAPRSWRRRTDVRSARSNEKGACHDSAPSPHDRGHDSPQLRPPHDHGVHPVRRQVRRPLPRLTRTPRPRARPLLLAPPGPGATPLLELLQPAPLCLAVPLPRHPRPGRGRRPDPCPKTPKTLPVVLSLEETARFLDAPAQPQAPRRAHDRLRRRVATLRGRHAPRRGHRQRPHGHPPAPGQGTQGPRRHALAATADHPPPVLEDPAARTVPLPRTQPRPADHRGTVQKACEQAAGVLPV